jgi:hypothetical protein
MSESIENLLMKFPIPKIKVLFEQLTNNNDENALQSSIKFSEIKKELKTDNINIIKLLYYYRELIHSILYDKDQIISLDDIGESENLAFYYYLCLLIKNDKEIVDYSYSLDLIKNINELQKSENNNIKKNNIYKKIMISKIIIQLIDYYKELDNYEEDNIEIKEMENYNKEFLKNNYKELNQKMK